MRPAWVRCSLRLLLLSLLFAQAVHAQQDTTPPVLASFSYTPLAVDTSAGSQTVTLTAHVTDDLAGLSHLIVTFRSPTGVDSASRTLFASDRISGDALDGVYEDTLTIPAFVEPGAWTITTLRASDPVGNAQDFDPASFGPATLDVTSNQDTTPPVLESFSFAPQVVDASAGSQAVTLTAHVTDDLAGLSHLTVTFRSPTGVDSASRTLFASDRISGDALDGVYEDTLTIPAFVESGVWTITTLRASDPVGNVQDFDPASFGPATLDVTSNQDTTPPVLESFSFAPQVVDVSAGSQTVTLTAHVTDDLAGFSSLTVTFRSPTGMDSASRTLFASDRISGDALDGVYEDTLTIPAFVEPGAWAITTLRASDPVGNVQDFDPASFGPATLDVISDQDTTPPVLESFAYTPLVVSAIAGPQSVTLTAHVTDDLSGFSSLIVTFQSPTGVDSASRTLFASDRISGDALDGVYQETLTIPAFVEPGVWTITTLRASDPVGNVQDFDPASFGPDTLDVSPIPSLGPGAGMLLVALLLASGAVATRRAPRRE